jgi:hypothetical protein
VRTPPRESDRTLHEEWVRLSGEEIVQGEIMKSAPTKRSLVKRLRVPLNIAEVSASKAEIANLIDKLDAIGEALAYLIEKHKLKKAIKKARRK